MSLEAYVTDIGKGKLTAAAAGGPAVVLAEGAVGDGNGDVIAPTPGMTALVREVWRDDLSSVGLDPQNPSCILVEIVVPIETGGYWVREVGIFDGDGDLFAVAAFPETYKPPLQDGSGTSLDILIPIPVTDTAQVSLVVDATKVWVTLQAMQAALAAHDADPVAHGDLAGLYASIGHLHDDRYAQLGHNHDGDYAGLGHDHDGAYVPIAGAADLTGAYSMPPLDLGTDADGTVAITLGARNSQAITVNHASAIFADPTDVATWPGGDVRVRVNMAAGAAFAGHGAHVHEAPDSPLTFLDMEAGSSYRIHLIGDGDGEIHAYIGEVA